jgi:hypothetical protein
VRSAASGSLFQVSGQSFSDVVKIHLHLTGFAVELFDLFFQSFDVGGDAVVVVIGGMAGYRH